jgi:hypothetical protein
MRLQGDFSPDIRCLQKGGFREPREKIPPFPAGSSLIFEPGNGKKMKESEIQSLTGYSFHYIITGLAGAVSKK